MYVRMHAARWRALSLPLCTNFIARTHRCLVCACALALVAKSCASGALLIAAECTERVAIGWMEKLAEREKLFMLGRHTAPQ